VLQPGFDLYNDANGGPNWFNLKVQMAPQKITPRKIVDFWADRLLAWPLSDEAQTVLVEYTAQGESQDEPLAVEESEILEHRLRNSNLKQIFPGFGPYQPLGLIHK